MDSSGRGEGWESSDAMTMLHSCIYYYMKNNNMDESAKIFAKEANLLHLPPAGDETFLTDWWSIFWDKYCAPTGQTSGPSSSLVQPGNVMGNAQQSIHGMAPVEIDQPVPLGADMDTMKMLDSIIYYYMKKKMLQAAEFFAIEANVVNMPPDGAEIFLTEWWPIFWDNYCAKFGQNSGPVGESSSPLVQPDVVMGNAQISIHGKSPVASDQQVPLGADMDTMMMTWQQPAAHLLAANNYQGRQPAEAPDQVQGQRLAQRIANNVRAHIQAKADRKARSQAKAISELQAGASSTNVSSQQVQSLMVGAQSQHQVPPRGNRDGASQGRSITPGHGDSTGTNQQEADVSKELGSRSKKYRLN